MARDGCKCCFSFWAISCPLTSLAAQKVNISKIKKKAPGDIIILHKCTKNHDHMLYCPWDMAPDTFNCFSFWEFFPFYPANSPKKQNFKKMKKNPGDIIILHMCTKKYHYMMYGSWDIVGDRWTDGKSDI